jgi:probable rRNA maturation factor
VWLSRNAPARARGEVSLAVISDVRMRTLNRVYRGKDEPTDVLSFREASVHLGEIVIAKGVAARQARRCGHALRTELRVLALHGLLHLLGYDHEVDDGRMVRLESRLRRRAGLPAGLTERGRVEPKRTAAGRPRRGPR